MLNKVNLNLLITLVFTGVLLWSSVSVAASTELVVVVNKHNDIQQLNKKQVIDLYMGRYSSFPNGTLAKVIDHPAGSTPKQDFYLQLVNKDERKIRSYWSRLLFSGRAKPPLEADSSSQVAQIVASDTNVLAYLPIDQLTPEMKIVYQFDNPS